MFSTVRKASPTFRTSRPDSLLFFQLIVTAIVLPCLDTARIQP
jgi:hypothetical protein